MTVYVITTSNWNSPAFWATVSESSGGHTLDFSSLPSSFDLTLFPSTGELIMDDGISPFTVGDASNGGTPDATLGGSTLFSFFNEVLGGDGHDFLVGASGNDTIVGNDGNDSLSGENGDDSIDAGNGNDRIYAGSGTDTVFAGAGDDSVGASIGADLVYGGDGNDTLEGGGFSATGHDTLFGEAGNDLIDGFNGNDELDGGSGQDTLSGGNDNDTLTGGADNDTLTGGNGDDVFVLADGSGADVITDFDNIDSDFDGFYNDQFDVTGLTDAGGNPVEAADVVVTDDGFGNALLTFPNGESVILQGVTPAEMDSLSELRAAGIPCFTDNTLIATPRGEIPVEALRPGDRVMTLDCGAQTIRWIGRRSLGPDILRSHPKYQPVLIPAGALGNHTPLTVSPLHGVMVGERHGAPGERLVRARHLTEVKGKVRVARGKRHVTYVHLMLDAHHILWANGALCESFYPGPSAIAMFSPFERQKIYRLVPGLEGNPVAETYGPTVRPFLKRREVLKWIDLTVATRRLEMGSGWMPVCGAFPA